jgi:hypothetical protein
MSPAVGPGTDVRLPQRDRVVIGARPAGAESPDHHLDRQFLYGERAEAAKLRLHREPPLLGSLLLVVVFVAKHGTPAPSLAPLSMARGLPRM